MARGKETPRPWQLLIGGNFIRIGGEGYLEYEEREHYLGGPYAVASMQFNATKDHFSDMAKALANAKVIIQAVNSYDILMEALSDIAARPVDKGSCRIAREALFDCSQIALKLQKEKLNAA